VLPASMRALPAPLLWWQRTCGASDRTVSLLRRDRGLIRRSAEHRLIPSSGFTNADDRCVEVRCGF
jgi:hypothetical protein